MKASMKFKKKAIVSLLDIINSLTNQANDESLEVIGKGLIDTIINMGDENSYDWRNVFEESDPVKYAEFEKLEKMFESN